MNPALYNSITSYFEIGGKIIESVLTPPQVSQGTYGERKVKNRMIKESHKASIEAIDVLVGDRYDVKRGARGGQKVRAGGTSISTGYQIAKYAVAAAAADGPLPFGDAIAAVILIGGGAYMVYDGYADIRQ